MHLSVCRTLALKCDALECMPYLSLCMLLYMRQLSCGWPAKLLWLACKITLKHKFPLKKSEDEAGLHDNFDAHIPGEKYRTWGGPAGSWTARVAGGNFHQERARAAGHGPRLRIHPDILQGRSNACAPALAVGELALAPVCFGALVV
eukprot:1144078-Pelagomonas_calceolata.AAC.1